ncbi:cation transporter, partial [Komagataeibacter swingsii]
PPHPDAMGGIGLLALAVNLACALILWTHRKGDANRRSVWICSRNDAIGNVAVVLAALGVFGTRSAWPDIAVAAILAMLGISGGVQIMRQSRVELTDNKSDISRHINV